MAGTAKEVRIKDMRRLTVGVHVSGVLRWRVRVGTWLMRLGARIATFQFHVEHRD